MEYIVVIIVFVITIHLIDKNFFRWETVIKHLWKTLYLEADQMASHMKQFDTKDFDKLSLGGFKSQIDLRGNLINSILDYINTLRLEEDVNAEEETFGYGRYNFDIIFMLAKANPDSFKKFK